MEVKGPEYGQVQIKIFNYASNLTTENKSVIKIMCDSIECKSTCILYGVKKYAC